MSHRKNKKYQRGCHEMLAAGKLNRADGVWETPTDGGKRQEAEEFQARAAKNRARNKRSTGHVRPMRFKA